MQNQYITELNFAAVLFGFIRKGKNQILTCKTNLQLFALNVESIFLIGRPEKIIKIIYYFILTTKYNQLSIINV